jgi:hypothetical protein
MVIFVNELGSNTNQKQNGDNEKYMVLGFTVANGTPLMCAIILATDSP